LAGLIAVLLYRLTRRAYDRKIGLAAGLATGLATPTILWATIPKRHVPVAALAICSLYFLYRSRTAETTSRYRRFRLLAYLPVGLSAWVFVGGAGLLLLALALVDIASSRENGPRTLAGIGGVVLVSLVPFFVTNSLLTGDPLTSPGMLNRYTPPVEATGTNSGGSGGGGGGSSPPVRGASSNSALPAVVQQMLYFLGQLARIVDVLTDHGRLTTIFLRSGWFDALSDSASGAISLSVTESMPLVGALVGLPALVVHRLRNREFSAIHTADAFVLLYATFAIMLYLPRLPGHAQLTVRYLFPLYPLAVYALLRLPWVREVLRTHHRLLGWTYAGGVLIGGQLALAGLVLIDATFPEAMQGLALVGLATAGGLAVWSLASASGREWPRVGAVTLGLAGAAATNLYLIVVLYYYGANFALPIIPG
jgi:4-amino-4-deoxy-L-arabinose transferase-like glycosyltransferase